MPRETPRPNWFVAVRPSRRVRVRVLYIPHRGCWKDRYGVAKLPPLAPPSRAPEGQELGTAGQANALRPGQTQVGLVGLEPTINGLKSPLSVDPYRTVAVGR